MKDFVLMENSPSVVRVSRDTSTRGLQAQVDAALLDENGPELVRELAKGSPLESDYLCLASLVEVTRKAVPGAVGDGFFGEYLQAQFMILPATAVSDLPLSRHPSGFGRDGRQIVA